MQPDSPHILFINPWIHDFAAYDFWAKPYGLLQLAAILRGHGFRVSYVDCLDRFHPEAPQASSQARYGRGPYLKRKIPPPRGLQEIKRRYSRYGIEPAWFQNDLAALSRPDLILVTSLMTYWYPGVQETIREVRKTFPRVPIVLGGIYATLCREHAELHAGADIIAADVSEAGILPLVSEVTGWHAAPLGFDPENLNTYPVPAFDLQRHIPYMPLLTSRGCPFDCAYCASKTLYPGYRTQDPQRVAAEIQFWHTDFNVTDFAFYDDALLVNAQTHAVPMLEKIVALGKQIRFHTPNAVHIRGITAQTARLMADAGFKTLRLGLETYQDADRERLDKKTTAAEFKRAVEFLHAAGFAKEQLGAYLLVGLPGQQRSEIEASIRTVGENGVTPILAHYTPIPHTRLWPAAVEVSRFDLAADPVFTNNAVSPCRQTPFSWEDLSHLKQLCVSSGTGSGQ